MNNTSYQAAKLAAALALVAGMAAASPNTSNIISTFNVTIAFGGQGGGGASTSSFSSSVDYSTYYNALVTNSSGDATDTTAIASLGGATSTNPVTSSPNITLSPILASTLGVGAVVPSSFAECDGLVANACIQVGTDVLNASGVPMGSLMGTVEHEVDEVLGTTSALPNGGGALPTDPTAADLFRYGAPGTRSFAFNTSTDIPCTGSPIAYFSIDGGNTNLNQYNNCNNGGDYGDWIYTDGLQVQDAFGPDDVASSLNLSSPEMTLLDAVGYNFVTGSSVPEPSSFFLMLTGLAVMAMLTACARITGKYSSENVDMTVDAAGLAACATPDNLPATSRL